MFALPDLQQHFFDAIMGDTEAEESLLAQLDRGGDAGRRRIDAYRRSILGNLGKTMRATYPVIERIVGPECFRAAARSYILGHASTSGDLNEYGSEFPEFLASYAQTWELAYLPDVARLEWLVQAVYYAADPPPIDMSALATTSPERLGELCFVSSIAHARCDSVWPLHDIWRVNARDYSGAMAVDFSQPSRLLLRRQEGKVFVELLQIGDAILFDRLAAGATLSAATLEATQSDPAFDLGKGLRRLIETEVLVAANLGAV